MSQAHRDALKRLLIRNDAGEDDYYGFQVRCIRKFGPAAGLFIRQQVYWVGKEHDSEGWIYKTQDEMEKETGLSRYWQRKARKILCSHGVIKEDLRGIPRKLWYWVDLEVLLRVMESPHSTMNQWARKHGTGDTPKTSDEGYGSSWDSITEYTEEVDSTIPASEYVNTDPTSEYGNNAPASEDGSNGRAITESTAQSTTVSSSDNYSSENSILQIGASRTSHGSTPHKGMGDDQYPKPSIGGLELNRIYHLLIIPGSKVYGAYTLHRQGSLSLPDLAKEVCLALTGRSVRNAEKLSRPTF